MNASFATTRRLRQRPWLLAARPESPRHRLLVQRLSTTRLMQRDTERLRGFFDAAGYEVTPSRQECIDNGTWARLASRFSISTDEHAVEVLHDLSVRADGSVLSLMVLLRPNAQRPPSAEDVLTMSTVSVGTLRWEQARRRAGAYSFACLLHQLRRMQAFSAVEEAWLSRVQGLAGFLEP